MKNAVQSGKVLSLIAPYAVASGNAFKVGAIVAVAQADAASGAPVEGVLSGVFEMPKFTSQSWAIGDKIYWDDFAKLMTTSNDSTTLVGVATAAATNSGSTGFVRLDGVVR
jgi:predicted RecA/RadA family phage recombinase